jgi:hypothetical protein
MTGSNTSDREDAASAYDGAAELWDEGPSRLNNRLARLLVDDYPLPFDGAVAGFSMSHVAEPIRALAEARRIIRDGGAVAAASWPAGWAWHTTRRSCSRSQQKNGETCSPLPSTRCATRPHRCPGRADHDRLSRCPLTGMRLRLVRH